MLTALFAAILVTGGTVTVTDQAVAVIGTTPPPALARTQPVEAGGETVRVCRDVPRQSVQDQSTREFMRDHQRWTPPPSG